MAALVMLSGGIDSAAALLWLLREDAAPVHAHHIRLERGALLSGAESTAARGVVRILRARGHAFRFTEGVVDVGFVTRVDVAAQVMWAAANILLDDRALSQATIGWCEEDGPWGQAWKRSLATMAALFETRGRARPAITAPLARRSKAWMLDYVGDDLAATVWGCEQPRPAAIGFAECGGCETCLQYAAARRGEVLTMAARGTATRVFPA